MIDAVLLRHLEAALRGHARALRRDGLPVPASVLALADFSAMLRQGPTAVAGAAQDPDAGGVALLLVKRTAAALLGTSERTLERLIADGRLPAVRLSDGAVRIRRADLDDFVAGLPATTDKREPTSTPGVPR